MSPWDRAGDRAKIPWDRSKQPPVTVNLIHTNATSSPGDSSEGLTGTPKRPSLFQTGQLRPEALDESCLVISVACLARDSRREVDSTHLDIENMRSHAAAIPTCSCTQDLPKLGIPCGVSPVTMQVCPVRTIILVVLPLPEPPARLQVSSRQHPSPLIQHDKHGFF